jgi:hypothetical protein
MDLNKRRALLTTADNPDATLDYISGLQGSLQAFGLGMPTRIGVHYAPDQLIVEPSAFGRYLEALGTIEWESLEGLATAILGDFSNQLVARWARVVVTAPEGAYPGVGAHEVMVEERQPGWDNEALLSRLSNG